MRLFYAALLMAMPRTLIEIKSGRLIKGKSLDANLVFSDAIDIFINLSEFLISGVIMRDGRAERHAKFSIKIFIRADVLAELAYTLLDFDGLLSLHYRLQICKEGCWRHDDHFMF
jgi:hypothetical protein